MDESPTSRDQIPPFLIRTFVKVGSFHRLDLFEDGLIPTTDEHQLYTWKDADLREIITTLRILAPHIAEYRHPLARFSFKTVYADPQNHGRFTSKDIGVVLSREILGEPGALGETAPRLLEEAPPLGKSAESMEVATEKNEKERESGRTLDDLNFVPGDYLLVAVLLPKGANTPSEIPIKGAAAPAWKNGPKADSGWSGSLGSSGTPGASGRGGGGHWRGGAPESAPTGPGRGRGAGRGIDRDRVPRERDYKRPPPPPREARRGGRRRSRSRSRSMSISHSRSRSRSPRRPRYRD